MKLISLVLIVISYSLLTVTAFADNNPVVVPARFSKVYVPDGFDDNDNVQIVGEGMFSNSCYRYASTEVSVDHNNKKIRLTPTAYKYSGMCLMVIMPFDRALDLGILKKGTYSIVQGQEERQIGHITIHAAIKPEADDYMYAPITQAFFKSDGITNHVFLTGNFPLSCMKLKEVKTHVQSDVFVLQPIVEIDKSVPCAEGEYPFETSVNAGALKQGRYLIHVRSMNGKSINSLVDVPN